MALDPSDTVQTPLPTPLFTTPYQSGITDPIWPLEHPSPAQFDGVNKLVTEQATKGRIGWGDLADTSPEALAASYQADYAGRVSRQKCMSILRADVLGENRAELINILTLLTEFSVEEMLKTPSHRHVRILEDIPNSYRVTITVAFGASLFTDAMGYDRFGIAGQKPKYLKPMPAVVGDADSFDPAARATDLALLISSDHPYINVATLRFFAEYFNKRYHERFEITGKRRPMLRFYDVEDGFQRKDKREFLKFDDGIDNLHMGPDDLKRLVYVEEADNEPAWCANGTYMVYRKIREDMPNWEVRPKTEQENMIGREKETDKPLSRQTEADGLTPIFPDPLDARDGPLNAHIRKVQPRRPMPDLFGIDDKERRFLRRPYPFFDGLDETGQAINGLHFVAFMKSIQQQFEHVVNMWQLNPDFPEPGVGIDALYASGVLKNIDGGYYFCPPGLRAQGDFFGAGMFE